MDEILPWAIATGLLLVVAITLGVMLWRRHSDPIGAQGLARDRAESVKRETGAAVHEARRVSDEKVRQALERIEEESDADGDLVDYIRGGGGS